MQVAPVIIFKDGIRARSPQPMRLDAGVFAESALAPALSQRLSVLGVHGAGIFNEQFVGGTQDAVRALTGVAADELPALGERMAGSLTVYVWDAVTRRVTVLADPLGGSLVFLHRDADGVAVSSHMGGLVALRERQGKPMRKSLANGLSTLVTGGAGGLQQGSYEGVELLDHFHFIEVDREGVRIRSYRSRDEFYGAPLSYEDGLDRVEAEILRNVRVVSQASHARKISQLTGGLDSRMVLGALQKAGVSDGFAFNCMGRSNTSDKMIAHGLASEFGLTMTNYTGLSAYSQPETFNDRVLAHMRYSSGLHMTPAHARMRRSQALVLSGGYGELFRSPYRPEEKPVQGTDAHALAEIEWGAAGFGEDPRSRLISIDLMDRYVDTVDEMVRGARGAGFGTDAWRDYYYIRRRNRFFVGEISRQWTPFASRFDPLYSVSAGQVMLRQPWAVRKSGVFLFDLMRRLGADLPRLPFDFDRYNVVYREMKGAPDQVAFSSPRSPQYNDWEQPMPHNFASVQVSTPNAAQKALAKKLRAPIQQVVELDRVRRETRAMVGALSEEDRTATFNSEGIRMLYGRAERHGWSLRCLFVIHSVLLWYTDTESPTATPSG
ncbi:hypothetical protein NF556_19890 [Ornithinimicrobium faecis]|uniref:Asparagine synthetase domain-containing protein n=1 Tax=Ornithinimicrobium faecis TaxID=2934158 RepID=A0ABY4YU79_9MICO|nr:hypothetical protein [Ornithinimicrobium sp. HY1793]USQ79820.1 hypothetical protein NF556_19890 [Ornithinimicrobium sp. HY1793]